MGHFVEIDPICEQLVPQLHGSELLNHLLTELLDTLIHHMDAPGDYDPN